MLAMFKDVWRRRELLLILVGRNLKIRYKGSVLGFVWSLLTPLLMIGMYAIFARIMRWSGGRNDFFQFLVVGVVVWHFLSMCLNDSLSAIVGNSNLVKKTSFPRLVLPLSMVLANLVNFLLTLIVLFAFLICQGVHFGSFLTFPLVVMSQCALCLGLTLVLSTLNVFFRDTEHILGVGVLAWFFMSPVFYPPEFQLAKLPLSLGWLAYLNPMTGILSAYRYSFLGDAGTGPILPALSFAVCWVILVIGLCVFASREKTFADEL